MFKKNKRSFIITILIVFIFTVSVGTFTPNVAKAQISVVFDATATVNWVKDAVDKIINSAWREIVTSAFQNTFQMFVRNFAIKAAKGLAYGAPGNQSLWNLRNWESFLDDAGEAARAKFLDEFAAGYGVDICQPPSGIDLKLNIGINLDTPEEDKLRCSLDDIRKKWYSLGNKIWGTSDEKDVLGLLKLNGESLRELGFDEDQFGFGLELTPGSEEANRIRFNILQSTMSVNESDLGFLQKTNTTFLESVTNAVNIDTKNRVDPDSAKPETKVVTGDVTVPAQQAEEKAKNVDKSFNEEWLGISKTDNFLLDTSNIFFSTLASESMKALMKKLLTPPSTPVEEYEGGNDDYEQPTLPNLRENSIIAETEEILNSISHNISPMEVDVISDMEIYLGNGVSGEMNNGTIDSSFSQILRMAQGGQSLTLREAINQNLLDQNNWFGYVETDSDDPEQPDVSEGFSADNIKKLVKNRVVPVGWQFAAEMIKEGIPPEEGVSPEEEVSVCSSGACTIKEVIEQYDKSGTYTIDGDEYKDDYCGWRPISAQPYFIDDILTEDACVLTDGEIEGVGNVKLKWQGGTPSSLGYCYKYSANSETRIVEKIEDVTSQYSDEDLCSGVEEDEPPGSLNMISNGDFELSNDLVDWDNSTSTGRTYLENSDYCLNNGNCMQFDSIDGSWVGIGQNFTVTPNTLYNFSMLGKFFGNIANNKIFAEIRDVGPGSCEIDPTTEELSTWSYCDRIGIFHINEDGWNRTFGTIISPTGSVRIYVGLRNISGSTGWVDNIELREPENHYYLEWEPGGCMIKELDEAPLCHLVDPDIVLKVPPQQCNAKSYYSVLSVNNSSIRQEDCADVKHCIQENDYGKCIGGYDYCVKEENIWRLGGDTCNKEYNSCTTLIDDEGEKKSYLMNTLKGCPQEEVGCRDYVLNKEINEDGEYIWNNDASRIYFNGSVEECSDNDVGCNEFIEIEPGVNLVPNGSFEIDEGPEDEKPDGWVSNNIDLYSLNKDEFFVGNNSLYYDGGNDSFWVRLNAPLKGLYTLSYYVKGNGIVNPAIRLKDSNNTQIGEDIRNEDNLRYLEDQDEWQRKTGYLSIPSEENINHIELIFNINGNVYLDGIQFELNKLEDSNINIGEGEPSIYKEYGSKSKNYYKKAPDYLNCQDYDLNSYNCREDYNPCCDFVKYCPEEDLSCSAYYPTNGDPFVPAVIDAEDSCVAECNNYQTFVALPSYFDELENTTTTMDKNFIPETAKDCSEPSCELFTNIDKLESGAESKEYYSFVRQCVKPEETTTKLYYTWEGSDTSAFQLKTWKLLASNDFNDPFVTPDPEGQAPCTNILIGGTECVDDLTNVTTCDPKDNLDCRTFYDANAVPHNRLLSKTIPITEECINLRRELSNQTYKIAPSMSQSCDASNVGCITYKGNNSNNVRNIFTEDFESGSISGWMANIEDADNNIMDGHINSVHSSEAINYNGSSMKVWIGYPTISDKILISYNLTQAGVTIIPNKQYSLSFWAKAFGDNDSGNGHQATGFFNEEGEETQVFNSLFYQSAQAEEDSDLFLSFDNNLSVISQEWLLYKYDIIDFKTDENGDVILVFKININNYDIYDYDGIYIDNIILKGFTNSFDKIKNSWETPKICSDNNNQYLGCQKYRDLDNKILYLYQFSDLCPEENIGCTAMIDTQNSSMPWQQTFNAYCNDESDSCDLGKYYYKNFYDVDLNNITNSTVITPVDNLIYIVKDDAYSCISGDKGCQEMSIIDNDGLNQSVYVVNNPDYYIPYDIYGDKNSILCTAEYQNCVSFEDSDGHRISKIHPRNLTCEYIEDDTTGSGFKTKDGINCEGLLYNEDYNNFTYNIVDTWRPYDAYDNKYAALCPEAQNGCSGFIDPLDNLDLRDYIYSNSKINLNYNHSSQWKQANWSKSNNGEISNFNSDGISYHPAGTEDDYNGLNVTLEENQNLLIYRGPDYDQEAFFFDVESDSFYRLSARVKLDDVDSVMTFLSCRPSKTSTTTPTSFNNYFVSEEWYENENKIPYAFPAIKSNYSVTNNGKEEWQYIYGLYKILPGAHYCNLAFYINGDVDSKFIIADINLEKVEGDYYYLDNDNLDRESCNSGNLKEGCVLFQDITDSSMKWNYEDSYSKNSLIPGDKDFKMPNNVNAKLKVIRDKQCAEWLTCGSSLRSLDPTSDQPEEGCTSLISCDELSEDKKGCGHFFSNGQNARPLTLDYYQQMRGKAGWSDLDYSGYSIPGLYPLDALTPIDLNDNTVLGHIVIKQNDDGQPFVYKLGVGVKNYLIDIYNQSIPEANLGSNLIDGQGMIGKSCRLYPEEDSPFPWIKDSGIVTHSEPKQTGSQPYMDIQSRSSNFERANICQTGSGSNLGNYYSDRSDNCDCSYIKANYGSENLYFPYDYEDIPPSISKDYEGTTSTTLKLRSQTKQLGWRGFCLDQDKSLFINNTQSMAKDMQDYRCLTWYPIDLLSGEVDSYNIAETAEVSFDKVVKDSKLCAVAEDWAIPEDRVYCVEADDTICKTFAIVGAGSFMKGDQACTNMFNPANYFTEDNPVVNMEMNIVQFASPGGYTITNEDDGSSGFKANDSLQVYQMNLNTPVSLGVDGVLAEVKDYEEILECYAGPVMYLSNRPTSFRTLDGNSYKVKWTKHRCNGDWPTPRPLGPIASTLYNVGDSSSTHNWQMVYYKEKRTSDCGCCHSRRRLTSYFIPALHPVSDWDDDTRWGYDSGSGDNVYISTSQSVEDSFCNEEDGHYQCLSENQINDIINTCSDSCDGCNSSDSDITNEELTEMCWFRFNFASSSCSEIDGCTIDNYDEYITCEETCNDNSIDDFFTNFGNQKPILYQHTNNALLNINNSLPSVLSNQGLNMDNFYSFLSYWKSQSLSLDLNDLWADGTADPCLDDYSTDYSDDVFSSDSEDCDYDSEPDDYSSGGRKDPNRDVDCWTVTGSPDNAEQGINDGWLECALIRKLSDLNSNPATSCSDIQESIVPETTLIYYDTGVPLTVDINLTNPGDASHDGDGSAYVCHNLGWINKLYGIDPTAYTCNSYNLTVSMSDDNNDYYGWIANEVNIVSDLPPFTRNWCDNLSGALPLYDSCIWDTGCIQTCKTYISLDNAIYNSNNFYLNWLPLNQTSSDYETDRYSVCGLTGGVCTEGDSSGCVCPEVLSSNINQYGASRKIRFNEVFEWDGTNSAWFDVYPAFSANIDPELDSPNLRDMILVDERPGSNNFFNDYYSVSNLESATDALEKVIVKIPSQDIYEYSSSNNDWLSLGYSWDRTISSELPIIKQAAYNINNIEGYSEGDPGISINKHYEKHIWGSNGSLYANLRFYGYTAPGTAPIQRIEIDWTGEETDQLVLDGPFKNHKHDCVRQCGASYKDISSWTNVDNKCVTSEDCSDGLFCLAKTWGDHEDACIEDNQSKSEDGFFFYSHIYTCDALSKYWKEESDCQSYDSSIQGGCCIYTPEVTITDNWGNFKTADLGDCANGKTCSIIVIPK